MPDNDRKKTRKDMMLKTREEVNADYKVVSSDQDPQERRKMQSQTFSAVFQTFFRILKHTVQPKFSGMVAGDVAVVEIDACHHPHGGVWR
ncbi:nucleolar complex-associated protein 3-like isoform X4 [Salvia miltiorrhiza]|uniref:nucleolar complex-associated protein 3-like isoform X4 n=1 Tax=Salvia miltiorrhiza TaxID=226208 RepID=UPI0025ACAC66|nr:nucleolar complex-associated protein 3-like isoform X4 [Salvia miltiorrhiza]